MPTFAEDKKIVIDFMKRIYPQMVEEPAGLIKKPFLLPGPAYGGQLWYQDIYCHLRGLIDLYELCKDDPDFDGEELRRVIVRHGKGSVETLIDIQRENGRIPKMISVDNLWWSTYVAHQKSTGGDVDQHGPTLCRTVEMMGRFLGDMDWLRGCYVPLKKYLAFYESHQMDPRTGLYFFHNDDMIGADNNPAVYGRPRNSSAELYLNGFLLWELHGMIAVAEMLGEDEDKRFYEGKAKALGDAIEKYCYCLRDGFYYPVDLQVETHRTELIHVGSEAFWNCVPIRLRMWTGFLPMMSGLPTAEKVERIIAEHYNDPLFRSPYGVRTLSADEPMYTTASTQNPSNWAGPIWLWPNYCIINGLLKYGHVDEAQELGAVMIGLLAKNIRESGMISESYVPETGESMLLTGNFVGFNILAASIVRELRDARETQ